MINHFWLFRCLIFKVKSLHCSLQWHRHRWKFRTHSHRHSAMIISQLKATFNIASCQLHQKQKKNVNLKFKLPTSRLVVMMNNPNMYTKIRGKSKSRPSSWSESGHSWSSTQNRIFKRVERRRKGGTHENFSPFSELSCLPIHFNFNVMTN